MLRAEQFPTRCPEGGGELKGFPAITTRSVKYTCCQWERADLEARVLLGPQLPASAWDGLVGEYRDLVGPTTEAPDEFHFAAFMVSAGLLIGRRLRVHYGNPLYANLYSLMVGQTGVTRKTTSQRRASGLAADAGADFIDVPGLGSAEGLLEVFQPDGRVVLVGLDEFTHALAKMEQKSSGTLEPVLLRLYDGHEHYQFPTRANPIEFRNPFLAILAATTPERLADHLRMGHIASGLLNRFAVFMGRPKAPIAFPMKPDQAKRNELVRKLHDVVTWSTAALELEPTAGALVVWKSYYEGEFYTRPLGDLAIQATERIPDHIWKLALLYSALNKAEQIDSATMERAIAVGRYLTATAATLAGDVVASEDARTERRIIKIVSEKGAISPRALHQALSGRVSADRFHRLTNAMVSVGLLVLTEHGFQVADDVADGPELGSRTNGVVHADQFEAAFHPAAAQR
jgi:hypothetical protein